jgi:hypothetical protein
MPQQRRVILSSPLTGHFRRETQLCTRAAHFQENALSRERKSSRRCFAAKKASPDRIASLAPAEIAVCAGAVFSGGRRPEPQAASAVPQPTDNTHYGSCRLGRRQLKREPNYSRVFGNFSAAAVSNLYYPASDRGASLILSNGLVGIGEAAASKLIPEFLLKRITRHVSPQANGKP